VSPPRAAGHDALVQATERALQAARIAGGNRAVRGDL